MRTQLLAALGLAAIISTPALAADPTCLQIGRIYGWKVVDNKTIIVEDDLHQKFKVTLMITSPTLTFKQRLGFKSIGGSELSCLTRGDEVLVRDDAMPSHNPISSIVPYTPAMEAADKAAAAAKAQQASETH